MDTIDVKELQINSSSLTEADLEEYKSKCVSRRWARSPFPIDQEINKRVILYDGDIELLRAEAIVNPTNENLNQLSYVSKLAGPELDNYIRRKIRLCATGDVRVTPGFESQYGNIIHAVPPKYQPKYKTAAETALFHTYFRIFETMIEKRLRTVVMPPLVTSKCNLPMEDNCNLQLRIIRRILEKKSHEFDRIVIHACNNSMEFYLRHFYCYFPQTSLDEDVACYHFDGSLGGANGEPVIPEREIRIKSKPAGLSDNSIDLSSGLDLSTVVGKTAFSKMREDLDLNKALQEDKYRTSGSSLSKYLARMRSSQKPANLSKASHNNQYAIEKQSVLKGCNLF